MDREINRSELQHQRAPSSSAAADLLMSMLFIAAFLIGLALMACMGLLRVLKELIDAKTSAEGAPVSEFNATDEAARTIGGDRYGL
jgi:hypothetical protein